MAKSLYGSVRNIIRRFVAEEVDDTIPVKVVAFSAANSTVDLQPTVQIRDDNGRLVDRGVIQGVPVQRMGGGGYIISTPISVGDTGWLKATDRDMSVMMQRTGAISEPPSARMHSFSDGFFIPDTTFGYGATSASGLEIRTKTGSSKIGLTGSALNLAGASMGVTVPETAWTGNLGVTGKVSATGEASGPNDLTNKSFVDSAISTLSGVLTPQITAAAAAAAAADTKAAQAAPAGVLAFFANLSTPIGWLKANGAAVSRTTYANLFVEIGTTYGAGDGSTTFNLPEARGLFLRGLDDGRGIDSGRWIGSFQDSQNLWHNHTGITGVNNADHTHAAWTDWQGSHAHYTSGAITASGARQISGGGSVAGTGDLWSSTTGSHGHNVGVGGASNSHQHDIPADGGSETRVKNIAFYICIKY